MGHSESNKKNHNMNTIDVFSFLFCTSKWLKFHIICVFKWWYLVFTKQWQMQQNFQWFCISCHDNEFRYSSVECLCCWNKKFTSLTYLGEIYSLSQIIASINFLLFLTIIYLSINYNWNGWKGENSKFLHWQIICLYPKFKLTTKLVEIYNIKCLNLFWNTLYFFMYLYIYTGDTL